MVRVYSPSDELELINIRSILMGERIPFFVHNDHFGSMKIGPRVELLNAKTLYVPQDRAIRARELIDDYLVATRRIPTRSSFWHTLRMLAEVALFGWFVPYRKHAEKDGAPPA